MDGRDHGKRQRSDCGDPTGGDLLELEKAADPHGGDDVDLVQVEASTERSLAGAPPSNSSPTMPLNPSCIRAATL